MYAPSALDLRKFNPAEPRIPAGGPHGGEWGHGGGLVEKLSGGIRKALQDAKTTDDISTVLQNEAQRISGQRYVDVNLAGLHPDVARGYAEGVLRGFEKFPKAKLDAIYSYGPRGAWRNRPFDKAESEMFAFTETYKGVGSTMAFNTRWAADVSKFNAEVGKEGGRFSVANDATGIALHEFGHAVATNARSDFSSGRIAQESAQHQHLDTSAHVAHEISNYAAASSEELSAEAFADVMLNGDKASPLSRQIYDEIVANFKKTHS